MKTLLTILFCISCTGVEVGPDAGPLPPDTREDSRADAYACSPCPPDPDPGYASPGWQTPIVLAAGVTILDYGATERDDFEREVTIRMVKVGRPVAVVHGPVTVTMPAFDSAVRANATPFVLGRGAHLIQVFREDIAPVNRGLLIDVWVETPAGRVYFSPITGNGSGRQLEHLLPAIDWTEP